MAGNFKPNDAGLRAILNGPEVRRALAEVADKGKEFAESISQDFRDSGEYAGAFEVRQVTVETTGGAHPGPRAGVDLVNKAGHAAAVEYGYEGNAADPTGSAHRVLGRTLEFLEGSS